MEKESKKNMKKFFEFVMKSKVTRLITLISIIVLLIAGYLLVNTNLTEKVSSEYISGKLSKSSELTTAKLNYTGMSHYEDAGIPFINRSDFNMTYHSIARAGIDMKEVKVNVNDATRTVHITIPKARVLDVKVDPKSIKYFDTHFALINTNEKEDASKAKPWQKKQLRKKLKKWGFYKWQMSSLRLLSKAF